MVSLLYERRVIEQRTPGPERVVQCCSAEGELSGQSAVNELHD